MLEYSTNKQGDTIEIHSDGVILNFSFWDCGCEDNYIKPVAQKHCDACGSTIDDGASSREDEVQEFIY